MYSKPELIQGGDMKFLQSRIYFEMKYLRENSTLIPILRILPDTLLYLIAVVVRLFISNFLNRHYALIG